MSNTCMLQYACRVRNMAATVDVKVKWGKQQRTVTVDRAAGISALKASLEALFGVPQARQKIMCPKAWRGAAKAETALTDLADGAKVMLMGTAEVLTPPSPPHIHDSRHVSAGDSTGTGAAVNTLVADEGSDADNAMADFWPEAPAETRFLNLGNTSYINSTIQ